MKNIILYLWQLPQNILGLLVILFTNAEYRNISFVKKNNFWVTKKYVFGVSLGDYIIFGGSVARIDLQHEQGHQKQSLYLGWLYLLLIGLPSICGNIYARIHHKNNTWYYNLPWEKWADKLGGVKR